MRAPNATRARMLWLRGTCNRGQRREGRGAGSARLPSAGPVTGRGTAAGRCSAPGARPASICEIGILADSQVDLSRASANVAYLHERRADLTGPYGTNTCARERACGAQMTLKWHTLPPRAPEGFAPWGVRRDSRLRPACARPIHRIQRESSS
ncbi:hypothetical protein PSAC2689_30511 [Paraburkholderia sacchari]